MVIDLNYNYLINYPSNSLAKVSSLLSLDNSFDQTIISNAQIEWCLDQSQRSVITSSMPPVMLCDDWQKFGLFLDQQDLVFK